MLCQLIVLRIIILKSRYLSSKYLWNMNMLKNVLTDFLVWGIALLWCVYTVSDCFRNHQAEFEIDSTNRTIRYGRTYYKTRSTRTTEAQLSKINNNSKFQTKTGHFYSCRHKKWLPYKILYSKNRKECPNGSTSE